MTSNVNILLKRLSARKQSRTGQVRLKSRRHFEPLFSGRAMILIATV